MPETGSQQRLFTWADSKNQPCPVEIAVDWLCSSTHRPGNSRVGLINKTPPQSFLISSSSEDLINTFTRINNRITKIVFDVIKPLIITVSIMAIELLNKVRRLFFDIWSLAGKR